MGQITSMFTARNRHVRGDSGNNEDPEQQLAFSNTNGSYFGSHFLMCGCKFELAKPEAYLFGENSDLDQLGTKAINFPYPLGPLGNDEIRPLNLMINIRKETVKFQKIKNEEDETESVLYKLSCVFDSDCPCTIQIHFHARETCQDGEIQFAYRQKRVLCSEAFHFEMGANQVFNSFVFDSSQWDLSELSYTTGLFFPFVISIQTDGVDRPQMQTTMCTIEIANDSSKSVVVKPLRQKITCDGVSYLLQEIFGIENKELHGQDGDDGGLECIICMSDIRDTVILPCRHLCLCSNCADTLRYKLNNCPICRSPFRALIRLRAHRQTRSQIYETVTLVEGLNGSHCIASEETQTIRESSRSKYSNSRAKHASTHARNSSRTRKALHQVLTMEQLDDEKPVETEAIEMTYIANETKDEEIYVEESAGENYNEGFHQDSSSSTSQSLQVDDEATTPSVEDLASDENEDDEEENESFKRDNRRALQPGSRNSSSQLLEHSNAK